MSQPPAGWYLQPDGSQRYWDGGTWTEQPAPNAPAAPTSPPAATGVGFGAPAGRRTWHRRHKILTGLAAVVAVGLIGSLWSVGNENSAAAAAAGSQPAHSSDHGVPSQAGEVKATPVAAKTDKAAADRVKKLPRLGDRARDEAFEFVAKKLSCGHQSVGTSFMEQKAQGQFCFVRITVKNVGDDPQMLDGSNQYAFDAEGHKFQNETSAEFTLKQNKTFLEDIDPGDSIAGTVIFDVPQKTKITKLELHDSAFSGGVKVAVK